MFTYNFSILFYCSKTQFIVDLVYLYYRVKQVKCCAFFIDRDAVDAVTDRDGYNYDGYTLRVEFPRGSGPGGPGGDRDFGGGGFRGGRGGYGGGGFGGGRGGGGGGGRGGPPSRRSEYRVLVSGE